MQRSRRLVAVQRSCLGQAYGKLAIAARPRCVDEAVAGTVHRLEAEELLVAGLLLDEEHVLAELLPVPRGLPEALLEDQRRLHLEVAALGVLSAAQVLEDVPDHHPLRMPERRARRDLLEMEEVELDAEAA